MALYMVEAAYTPEAWKKMARHPEDRRKAVKPIVEQAGCRFVELYFTFGDRDVVLLIDAPDPISAAAVSIAAVSGGHLRSMRTTPLFTVEDSMAAMRKAGGLGSIWSQMPT